MTFRLNACPAMLLLLASTLPASGARLKPHALVDELCAGHQPKHSVLACGPDRHAPLISPDGNYEAVVTWGACEITHLCIYPARQHTTRFDHSGRPEALARIENARSFIWRPHAGHTLVFGCYESEERGGWLGYWTRGRIHRFRLRHRPKSVNYRVCAMSVSGRTLYYHVAGYSDSHYERQMRKRHQLILSFGARKARDRSSG